MKNALKPSGCGMGIPRPLKRLWQLRQTLYGAFLRWRLSRKCQSEMDSLFRTAEAMGLNPMSRSLPPFLQDRITRVHAMVATLRGLNQNTQP